MDSISDYPRWVCFFIRTGLEKCIITSVHNLLKDWSRVDYCDVFINSHSDGTHSLLMIHWWASDEMQWNSSRSCLMKKRKLIYILDGLRDFKIFNVGSTIPLNVGSVYLSLSNQTAAKAKLIWSNFTGKTVKYYYNFLFEYIQKCNIFSWWQSWTVSSH